MIPLVGIAGGAGLALGAGAALLDAKRDERPFEGGKPNFRSAATLTIGAGVLGAGALAFAPVTASVALLGGLGVAGAVAGAAAGSYLLGRGKGDTPEPAPDAGATGPDGLPQDPMAPVPGTGLEPGADAGDAMAPTGPGYGDGTLLPPDPGYGDGTLPPTDDAFAGEPLPAGDPYGKGGYDAGAYGKGGYDSGLPQDGPPDAAGIDPAFDAALDSGSAPDAASYGAAAASAPALADAAADPALIDPAMADPALADPALAEPAVADPAVAEPALAEPAFADAGMVAASGGKGGYDVGQTPVQEPLPGSPVQAPVEQLPAPVGSCSTGSGADLASIEAAAASTAAAIEAYGTYGSGAAAPSAAEMAAQA